MFQENGIIADIAPADHSQHLGPDGCMMLLVSLQRGRGYTNHRTVALHILQSFRKLIAPGPGSWYRGRWSLTTIRLTGRTLHHSRCLAGWMGSNQRQPA